MDGKQALFLNIESSAFDRVAGDEQVRLGSPIFRGSRTTKSVFNKNSAASAISNFHESTNSANFGYAVSQTFNKSQLNIEKMKRMQRLKNRQLF